ncbi:MAG TPA: bifunctional transaldolase/phosoglucose isomerase [Polyangiales bacterium]|nr:bifunctional transaldolase/phosoglucose isomerase [Polyangiales bacterium]
MELNEVFSKHGQSIWLDYIRRHLLTSGELHGLVEAGLRGVTSNPTIFQKAIAGSTDYEATIRELVGANLNAGEIYERIAVADIQAAADVLRPVYADSRCSDGFVSLEVSPHLANDTAGTVAEARRLWRAVGRDNLMIKVPGTPAGIPAFRQLISEGINVNVTLLFSRAVCQQVHDAYLEGLEQRAAIGGDITTLGSVASVFVSRIDTAIDRQLEAPEPEANADARRELVGKIAIANARVIYQDWLKTVRSERWRKLAERGAHVQRPLWASTGTKDKRMSDVAYVEALIAQDTVNTLPMATLQAFRDHGRVASEPSDDAAESLRLLAALKDTGISLDEVTDGLREDGVRAFAESFDAMLKTIEDKRAGLLKSATDRLRYRLPAELQAAVQQNLEDWERHGKVRKLWARDAALWTGGDEARWLDWLEAGEDGHPTLDPELSSFAASVKEEFDDAVVLGMGGSSLCPEVLARTFGKQPGWPQLSVLDSTDPAQIRGVEARIDLERTLFVVSSKSGTTLEPNVLNDYFYSQVCHAVGEAQGGKHFVAVTDPGSALERVAKSRRYRRIFAGVPQIGGRYSALSNFGMLPAALLGLDVADFMDRTERMVEACAECVPAAQNPGVVLGTILGTLAKHGRDKLTLITSAAIVDLGAWLEQLVAESTGKQGSGIIPIDREAPGAADVYGADRSFVYLRLDAKPDAEQDAAVDALEHAGQPVVRISIPDARDLGQEFFRWEIATAVAGSILGINPFDQPDVEFSKVETRKLTDAYDKTGALPQEQPFYEEHGLALFADEKNQKLLERAAPAQSLSGYVAALLEQLRAGDYFAVLGYIDRNQENDAALQVIRHAVRDRKHVATCAEFGPRFLHSTGQAYKGGPNTGVFLQLTCNEAADLAVPGKRYTFGVVKAAQARGDLAVLTQRDRRALRVHLSSDVGKSLSTLLKALEQALGTQS